MVRVVSFIGNIYLDIAKAKSPFTAFPSLLEDFLSPAKASRMNWAAGTKAATYLPEGSAL